MSKHKMVYRFYCLTDTGTKYHFTQWCWDELDAAAVANSYEEVTGDKVTKYQVVGADNAS